MANATISIRVNENVKEQAQELFKSWGLDMSTAVNMFLCQTINEQRIPFRVGYDVPNAETVAAMKEAEEMANNGIKGYSSLEEMIKELDTDA